MNDITTIAKMVAKEVKLELEKKKGKRNMTEIEQTTRKVMQEIGRQTVMKVIQDMTSNYPEPTSQCQCGQKAKFIRRRETRLHTIVGKCHLKRDYYLCQNCHQGHFPLDQELGLRPNAFSAELERLVAMTGVQIPFGKGSDLFEELTQIAVSDPRMAKACQKVGETVIEQENKWHKKSTDYSWLKQQVKKERQPLRYYGAIDATKVHVQEADEYHWRDLKVGAWFEATGKPPTSPNGNWQIQAKNIQYYADIAHCAEFGDLFWHTGVRHKANLAQELIILGDGATWIWNLVAQHFPKAIQILDWFHAVEHLKPMAQALFSDVPAQEQWCKQAQNWLWDGKVNVLLTEIKQQYASRPLDILRTTFNYFESHKERMTYADFRKQGFQIGSGTIESAAKQIGMMRMKVPGATWKVENARKVSKARAAYLSDRWHSLPLAA